MLLLEVLIEHSTHHLDRLFSYTYSGQKTIGAGFRVLVEFNHRRAVAYVVSIEDTDKDIAKISDEKGFIVQSILDVIDEQQLLIPELMDLAERVSSYYMAPQINVLQTMLPPSLKPRYASLSKPKIAYEKYVRLIHREETGLTAKQIEYLRLIAKNDEVPLRDLKSPSIIKKLVEAGRIELFAKERNRFIMPEVTKTNAPKLTRDQQNVVYEFLSTNDDIYLLEGVTGSGKTEVYLAIADVILSQRKTVLMLVPEIALTSAMVAYFLARFANQVAILHSELTPSEKYDEYRRIARGECAIVVGARSAIFAPLKNIGLIILDEEHVESYKQDTSPFYHARDVAIMRIKEYGGKVLLGSATPSLESKARALKQVYHPLHLPQRINQKSLPETKIIDMLNPYNLDPKSSLFSRELQQAMKETLTKNEQIILLINRRGYSTYLSCRSCGHVFRCPTCQTTLTYHREDQMLKCHHCDHVEPMTSTCPECGSIHLAKSGFGTERVQKEVEKLFPTAKTLRLDSDTGRVRLNIAKTIEAFRAHEADILIGTQMIAKGHDFPNVTLVGIVLADLGLTLPSYRSAERTFQLITQAVGRSGRSDKKGIAIIQTNMPNHYAVTLGARQDYVSFFNQEMLVRRAAQEPPFMFSLSIKISAKEEEIAHRASQTLADDLKTSLQDLAMIIGPATPFIFKEGPWFKKVILIKYRNYFAVKPLLLTAIKPLKSKANIRLEVNVDPSEF